MIRRIIQIDEDKCNGCGACANACHEGAIGMVNGKAKLLRKYPLRTFAHSDNDIEFFCINRLLILKIYQNQ